MQECFRELTENFDVLFSHPPVNHCKLLKEQAAIGSDNIHGSVNATDANEALKKKVKCNGCDSMMTVSAVIKPQRLLTGRFSFLRRQR